MMPILHRVQDYHVDLNHSDSNNAAASGRSSGLSLIMELMKLRNFLFSHSELAGFLLNCSREQGGNIGGSRSLPMRISIDLEVDLKQAAGHLIPSTSKY